MVPRWRGNGQSLEEDQLGSAIDGLVYDSPKLELGRKILELGKLDRSNGSYVPNSSLHWTILFWSEGRTVTKILDQACHSGKIVRRTGTLLIIACRRFWYRSN